MTEETARFLLNLLNTVTLEVGSPGFDTTVASIQQAKTELGAVLALPPTEEPSSE